MKMHAETINKFTQEDADAFLLTGTDDGGEPFCITMTTLEAVRLLKLANDTIGTYADEMERAFAQYQAGYGPNGEPPGSWELEDGQVVTTTEREAL